MADLAISDQRPAFPFRTQRAWSRFAAAKERRLKERRAAIVEFWAGARHRRWETEEEAQAHRRHTLLEDNPTSC
jgi:hypothetical protein